jgi:hypothetical protein
MDHDQRFKMLLKRFLGDFFRLFFPEWATRFDFDTVEWLDTEVFPDPPDGSRRILDLVALLKTVDAATAGAGGASVERWLSLVHIEVESSDSVQTFRKRMHWYYANLRQRHDEPILPVAVFLNVGLDGIGYDAYVETHGSLEVLRYQYLYVGLPKLQAVEYVQRAEPLAAALAALMKPPAGQRPQLKAQAWQRIAAAELTEFDRFLLSDCVDAYLGLDAAEESQFESILRQPGFDEVRNMATTTFEKGIEQGLEKGEERGVRRALRYLLRRRFGALPDDFDARLDLLSDDRLMQLLEQAEDVSHLSDLKWPE